MTIQHSVIPDGQRHEPKGISTAANNTTYVANGGASGAWIEPEPKDVDMADPGTSYVATGAGSGTWFRQQGWGQFQDNRRSIGTPTHTLATGVRTQLVCNGLNSTIQKSPTDLVNPLWNTSTNKIVPIAEFDVYQVRISCAIDSYAGASPYVDLALDIGGGIGEIYWHNTQLNKAGGTVRLDWAFPIYAGSTFNANGGTFYITYVGTGSCVVHSVDILIVRESKNYV